MIPKAFGANRAKHITTTSIGGEPDVLLFECEFYFHDGEDINDLSPFDPQSVRGLFRDLGRICVRRNSPDWRLTQAPYNCANLRFLTGRRYCLFTTTRRAGFRNSNWALTFSICAA
jgi:hypothetical protein